MDFKKPKNWTEPLVAVGAGTGGLLISNAIVSSMVDETATESKALMVKGGIAVASLVGLAMVSGSDTTAQATKAALMGAAVAQVYAVAKTYVAKSDKATANKMVANAFGLNAPRRRARALRSPMVVLPQYTAPAMEQRPQTLADLKKSKATVFSV